MNEYENLPERQEQQYRNSDYCITASDEKIENKEMNLSMLNELKDLNENI